MAAPSTISATGYFLATRAGTPVGEATLAMSTALKGRLALGAQQWNARGRPGGQEIARHRFATLPSTSRSSTGAC